MSQRMIDILFRDGAKELDRRTQTYRRWTVDMLRDRDVAGTGKSLFAEAEVLVVDNVTRYLYESCGQEEWGGGDYPNCAPPFPTFWMETRAPLFSQSGPTRIAWHGQHAWGALFIATEMPENLQETLTDPEIRQRLAEQLQGMWQSVLQVFAAHHQQWPMTPPSSEEAGRAWFQALPVECQEALQQYGQMHHALEGVTLTTPLAVQVRWHYTIFTFLQIGAHDPIIGPVHVGTTLVAPDGQLVPVPAVNGVPQDTVWGVEHGEALKSAERQELAGLGNMLLMPFWLGLSFLHCKNVTLTSTDPCHQRKPPKAGERCRRLHYHVLDIKPMQKILRREGRQQQSGLKRALHICRGHFKDYRQRGLFGKYQGLFWWESHIRGHSQEGLITKDYKIHTSKAKQGAIL